MNINFIITGGTIDSHYDGSKDTATPNEESVIPGFIKSLRLYSEAEFTTICMKDSRQLNIDDMNGVLTAIEKSQHTKIIVTHGTYTMPDTARFLKANLQRKDVTVILTGSAIPLNGFCPSDAPFSLGYAVAQLEYLKAGVYAAMNGRVFSPEEIAKNMGEARFYSIFERGDKK